MLKIKFLSLFAFIILILIGFSTFSFATNNEASLKLKVITQDIPENWWESSWDKKAELQAFISNNPSETALCAEAQYYLACNYYAQKDYYQAIGEYETLISTYPQEIEPCAKAQFEIAQVYFYYLQDIPMAQEEYYKVINNYGSATSVSPKAQRMLAKCLEKLKEDERALEEYKKFITTYLDEPLLASYVYRDIANLFMNETQDLPEDQKKPKLTEALSCLKQAYQTCPMGDKEGTDLMSFIIEDIYRSFRLLDGNLLRANGFIKYQKFGPCGPDKIAGTEDDLTNVLAQF